MYEKYYSEIVMTINSQVQKKWPALATGNTGIFAWAEKNQVELYAKERMLDADINEAWKDTPEGPPPIPLREGDKGGGDFEKFKSRVIEWGRVVLEIYKRYAEAQGK